MRESGYYPAGAEFDPRAPYNQEDPPELTFRRRVIVTIERDCDITTDDYDPPAYGDFDDEADTTCTDWEAAYAADHASLPDLLAKLREYLQRDLAKLDPTKGSPRKTRLRRLISDCEGWEETNIDFDLADLPSWRRR